MPVDPNEEARALAESRNSPIDPVDPVDPIDPIDPNELARTLAASLGEGKGKGKVEVEGEGEENVSTFSVPFLQSLSDVQLSGILDSKVITAENRNSAIVKISKMPRKPVIVKKVIGELTLESIGHPNVIHGYHIDEDRDKELGYSLSKYNLNYTPEKKNFEGLKTFSEFHKEDIPALPMACDVIRQNNFGPIYDQGSLGSCLSNATSSCMKYLYFWEKKIVFSPSRLFIYYNGRASAGYPIDQDTGLSVSGIYKSIPVTGVCTEDQWPYNISQFAVKPSQQCYIDAVKFRRLQGITVPQNLQVLQQCISMGYPVQCGIQVYESFMSANTAKTGIVPYPNVNTESLVGGHAVVLLGYDNQNASFLYANSWGTNWGLQGYCWIPYKYILDGNLASDFISSRYFD